MRHVVVPNATSSTMPLRTVPSARAPRQARAARLALGAGILLPLASACRAPAASGTAAAPATPAGAASRAVPDVAAGFVSRLGQDTLVVERVTRGAGGLVADVLLRSPRTQWVRSTLALDGAGRMTRAVTEVFPVGADGARAATPVRRETLVLVGDSLRSEVAAGEAEPRARTVAAPSATLPWIDLVHWPYELALVRFRAGGADSAVQPMFTGQAAAPFRLARVGADSVTIAHPFRGTMRAAVAPDGRLLGLDAGATTRKLIVTRDAPPSDATLAALARRWAADDAAGRGIAALSGRAQATGRVGAATLRLDYGTPAMRGRAIWGALVPYGQVWRTGANEATHLETDRDLVLGAGADTLVVPAGRYTLFSIPAEAGGVLIVNRQTGQNGTQYDAARDLGRVPLAARPLAQPVESFTIAVDGAAPGLLRLQWGPRELVVPVRAR